jgi:predicted nucleic acid-binding Zn ribbon protein
MTTYVYESIPSEPGDKPRYFEFKQRMSDAPLTKHPDTGEPIRRVVSGGFGVLSKGKTGSHSSSSGGSCCGPSCGCH